MKNYVVRIYRRDPGDPEKIAGIVETVGSGPKKPKSFANAGELKNILSCLKNPAVSTKKKREILK